MRASARAESRIQTPPRIQTPRCRVHCDLPGQIHLWAFIRVLPRHVPRGLARNVGSATVGSSGHGWRGYCPRMSLRTSA